MAERSKAFVLKAIVLRYRGFESLFARNLNQFNGLKKLFKKKRKNAKKRLNLPYKFAVFKASKGTPL